MPETQSAPARVYLVDDEASVRRGFTRLLRASGYETLSYASAEAFLSAVERRPTPCCLLLDLSLPGLSGLDVQVELERLGISMAVVFVSGRADVASGVRAMKGGAVDFLEKPVTEELLLAAIERALDQHRRRLASEGLRTGLLARLATLTPREREVFGLVVTGRLNKQVGAELGTTEKTVKVHRARVMQKMGAGSLADLVRIADTLGDPGRAEAAGLDSAWESRSDRPAWHGLDDSTDNPGRATGSEPTMAAPDAACPMAVGEPPGGRSPAHLSKA